MKAVIPPPRVIEHHSLYVLLMGNRYYYGTSTKGAFLTAWSIAGAYVFTGSQAATMRKIRDAANLRGRDCRIVPLVMAMAVE